MQEITYARYILGRTQEIQGRIYALCHLWTGPQTILKRKGVTVVGRYPRRRHEKGLRDKQLISITAGIWHHLTWAMQPTGFMDQAQTRSVGCMVPDARRDGYHLLISSAVLVLPPQEEAHDGCLFLFRIV